MTLGSIIVMILLMGMAALALRSIWKEKKAGGCGGCGGNCGNCPGCATPNQTK